MREQVLLVPLLSSTSTNILLKVSQQSEAKPLSLKLIATDHQHIYHATIKESTAKTLQASTFTGDLAEWRQILLYLLLHKKPDQSSAALPDFLLGVEITASGPESDDTISIILRKNIDGITQRLGSIKLAQDDEKEEVAPFEWVEIAVSEGNSQRSQINDLLLEARKKDQEVENLKKELEGLIEAKKQHEQLLLKKVMALLNSKKLKIRDQSKLLEGAQIDWSVATKIREARDLDRTSGGSGVGSSRKGKRKMEEGSDEEGSEMDEVMEDGDEGEARDETPEPSDMEDDADDVDGSLDASSPPQRESEVTGQDEEMEVEGNQEPVPKRQMPMRSPRQNGSEASSPIPESSTVRNDVEEADDDNDETDDEL